MRRRNYRCHAGIHGHVKIGAITSPCKREQHESKCRARSSLRDHPRCAQRGDGVWRHAEKLTQHLLRVFTQRRRG